LFLIVLWLTIFLSCKNPIAGDVDEVDTLAIFPRNNFPIEKLEFSLLSVVPLETTNDCFINTITNTLIVNDTIIVEDFKSQKIFIFNKDGQFITLIHKLGHGPEEYLRIKDLEFDYQNNCLSIYDDIKKCIHNFNLRGSYIGNVQVGIQAENFGIIKDGLFAFYINNNPYCTIDNKKIEFNIIIYDSKRLVYSYLDPFPNQETRELSMGMGSLNYGISINSKNELIYHNFHDNTVYLLINSELIPKYYLQFNDNFFPVKRFGEFLYSSNGAFNYLTNEGPESGKVYRIGYLYEINGLIFLTYFERHKQYVIIKNKINGEIVYYNYLSELLFQITGLRDGINLSFSNDIGIIAFDAFSLNNDLFKESIKKFGINEKLTFDLDSNPYLLLLTIKN
jgi:hypothetical protein